MSSISCVPMSMGPACRVSFGVGVVVDGSNDFIIPFDGDRFAPCAERMSLYLSSSLCLVLRKALLVYNVLRRCGTSTGGCT